MYVSAASCRLRNVLRTTELSDEIMRVSRATVRSQHADLATEDGVTWPALLALSESHRRLHSTYSKTRQGGRYASLVKVIVFLVKGGLDLRFRRRAAA